MMKEIFHEVLVVPGNHDYYLIKENAEKYNNYSSLRIKELKQICSEIGVHFLDGQIVQIKDKKFGGCMSSWDMSYYLNYYKRDFKPTVSEIKQYWLNGINDSNFMMDGMKPRLKSSTYEWGDRGLINNFNIAEFNDAEHNKLKNYFDFSLISLCNFWINSSSLTPLISVPLLSLTEITLSFSSFAPIIIIYGTFSA
jgi:hypothetical protein